MADIIPRKLMIPTGYEGSQEAIAARRKIAEAMMQSGLTPRNDMTSWAQVLGQLAQEFVGSKLEGRANKAEGALNDRIRGDYSKTLGDFTKDAGTMDSTALVSKYQGNPLLGDALKPYVEAMAAHIKDKEKPQDPTASVVRDANGNWIVNPVANTAALTHQGYGMAPGQSMPMSIPDPTVAAPGAGQVATAATVPPQVAVVAQAMGNSSYYPPEQGAGGGVDPLAPLPDSLVNAVAQSESGGRDFTPSGLPVTSPAGARFKMQVMPATAHDPGFGVAPAANDTPAEYNRVGREYLAAMVKRYGNLPNALAAYNAGPGKMDEVLAGHGQLPAETKAYVPAIMGRMQQPAGVTTDGRSYWIVNGVPYDNPEGK